MTTYNKLFTKYGLTKQAGRLYDGGEFEVSHIVIGDGNGSIYEPDINQTQLVNQRNILNIVEVNSNENIYQFFAKIPSDIEPYVIREIGLTDNNGNLLWVSQYELNSLMDIENVVTENIIGVQIEVSQGTTVVTIDDNIQLASKTYVRNNYQALNEKGKSNGYCPLDNKGLIPLNHLPLSSYPAACITGNYNTSSGYPDLISYSGSKCSFKVSDITGDYQPLKVTFADGMVQEFITLEDLDVSLLPNGTYNLYLDKNGVIHPIENNLYVSRVTPGGGITTVEYVTRTTTTTTSSFNNDVTAYGNVSLNGTTGVASNFSNSNYITLPISFTQNQSGQQLEIITKIKTPASLANADTYIMDFTYHYIGSNGTDLWDQYYGVKMYTNNGTLYFGSGKGNAYGSFAKVSTSITTNTIYWIKVTWNGSSQVLYTSSDGESWIQKDSISVNNIAWKQNCSNYIGVNKSKNRIFGGSIDLMNTSVKINSQEIWNGKITTTTTSTYQEKLVTSTGTTLSANDMWLDTSLKPYVMRKYDGSSNWDTVEYVRMPQQVIVSSGVISDVEVVSAYNANGWDEQLATPDLNRQTTLTNGSLFTAPCAGWVYNYIAGDTFFLEKGSGYTPSSSSSGSWYFSPLKGV